MSELLVCAVNDVKRDGCVAEAGCLETPSRFAEMESIATAVVTRLENIAAKRHAKLDGREPTAELVAYLRQELGVADEDWWTVEIDLDQTFQFGHGACPDSEHRAWDGLYARCAVAWRESVKPLVEFARSHAAEVSWKRLSEHRNVFCFFDGTGDPGWPRRGDGAGPPAPCPRSRWDYVPPEFEAVDRKFKETGRADAVAMVKSLARSDEEVDVGVVAALRQPNAEKRDSGVHVWAARRGDHWGIATNRRDEPAWVRAFAATAASMVGSV